MIVDADLQNEIEILPKALKYFKDNNLDMLNIARDLNNSKAYRFGHSFGNKLFSKVVSLLFGKKVLDMLSGYKIFSKAFIKSFPAHSNGFEIETELTIFALEQRLRIDEIFAKSYPRAVGSHSKLRTFKDGSKIAFMILEMLFMHKPIVVFGIFSLLFILLGIIFGIPVIIEFLETSKVPRFPTLIVCIGSEIVGVVLAIAGLLAHLVARNAKEARYLAYLRVKSASK